MSHIKETAQILEMQGSRSFWKIPEDSRREPKRAEDLRTCTETTKDVRRLPKFSKANSPRCFLTAATLYCFKRSKWPCFYAFRKQNHHCFYRGSLELCQYRSGICAPPWCFDADQRIVGLWYAAGPQCYPGFTEDCCTPGRTKRLKNVWESEHELKVLNDFIIDFRKADKNLQC